MLRKKRHLPLLHGRLVYSGHPLYRVLWTTKNKNGRSAQPVPSANLRHSETNKVHRKVDWSPSKSHQREQRANTYLFEQQQFPNSPALAWEALRFFIHSGLILISFGRDSKYRSTYTHRPPAKATTLSWGSVIWLIKGVSFQRNCVAASVGEYNNVIWFYQLSW